MKQVGFFNLSNRYESLSKFGDPLEKLNTVVNFEAFPQGIEKGLDFSEILMGNSLYNLRGLLRGSQFLLS